MWNEIIIELKEKIPTEWLEPIKEESFKDDILTLAVPDTYYAQKYETDYEPLIQNILKAKTGKAVGLQFQIVASKLLAEPVIKDEKPKAQLIKKTKFNGNPYFKNPAEFTKFAKETTKKEIEISIGQKVMTSMPTKYGAKDVITFSILNNKMFAYPNDKRKNAKVKMDIRFSNDTVKTFDLYRGQLETRGKGYGQLTTTHAKILLAVIHIWQEQGCKFADEGQACYVNTTVREIAKKLGYKSFSGADHERLLQKTKDLADLPMVIADRKEAHSFTILYDVSTHVIEDSEGNDTNRRTISIVFNPFIAKQLYDRKVILRKPQCYKIKNPTAIKFLLCYDKRIIKGFNLKMNISEVANDLEIETNKTSNIITNIKNAFQELNGYELNDSYSLHVELVKEGKEWIVIAERISKEKQQPLKALLA
ncbi:hypothetical protein AGMMS49929_10620 [Endomicrobiia bacterium]|nr:hypothetical protein AGMMS49571_10920 [Endomicrobiia bacterium]GHT21723.1 hypothetical protein AGMMS49929_10620 [Endomicrobiia bacterium]GHT28953.1 hypothetical protein AGMMS49995_10640 [Endomicrobiia bacterium]